MALSDKMKNEYTKRLLMSRMRILVRNGFYGLLLMHMTFYIDDKCRTASTDGRRIVFDPDFLDVLSDSELDYVMMHEILHVVLQHCLRHGDSGDDERFNIACDIVVNSNILLSEKMDLKAITLCKFGVGMHIAPDGKEGYEYTAEHVYSMLPPRPKKRKQFPFVSGSMGGTLGSAKHEQRKKKEIPAFWDDHTIWGMYEEDDALHDVWAKRFEDACESVSIRDPSNQRGLLPLFAQRLFTKYTKPQMDWKTILNDFVQEEINDYSFYPPDRRYDESPFFLPDYNCKEDFAENILFMVDTSGSMTDNMIMVAYSEVKGAIDQFDGKLKGWLGFFNAAIIGPKPFSDEADLKIIKPSGGGGTDFKIIFEYVQKHMRGELPASIIILTDGFAPFPKEELAMGIPVLWLINNDIVDPPWGKVTKITDNI